jgi:hypothetical protein
MPKLLTSNEAPAPKMTFAFAGSSTVRFARNVPCPFCGRHLHASDFDVTFGTVTLICQDCHADILEIVGTGIRS